MSDSRNRRIFGVPTLDPDQPSPFTLDDDPDEIRTQLALFNPELAAASYTVDDEGNMHFASAPAGNKG